MTILVLPLHEVLLIGHAFLALLVPLIPVPLVESNSSNLITLGLLPLFLFLLLSFFLPSLSEVVQVLLLPLLLLTLELLLHFDLTDFVLSVLLLLYLMFNLHLVVLNFLEVLDALLHPLLGQLPALQNSSIKLQFHVSLPLLFFLTLFLLQLLLSLHSVLHEDESLLKTCVNPLLQLRVGNDVFEAIIQSMVDAEVVLYIRDLNLFKELFLQNGLKGPLL
mmetsp:Transcript_26733/g.40787  ORF Transcript_26733/g.40787 Transcript_26733/m.40787 type:complete len:220 (-) Transcript_26733:1180-1839(-)